MTKIPAPSIESINVLKSKSATAIYGEKAKNGVVLIELKPGNLNALPTINTNVNNNVKNNMAGDTIPDKLFTKVENEASFPGGQEAWVKYIISKIKVSIDSFTNKDFGTCLVRFIVNKDGTVTNVEATTMKNSHLAKVSIEAIKDGPKWIPASQNGQIVAAYRLQPVTLTNPEKNN
jgi:TonB-dependent SusC/RagA subfamily outer membrane receptor